MLPTTFIRKLAIAGAMIPVALVSAPTASFAGVFISVDFAPPAIPVYTQPPCPGDGYLWTPGYWNYADAGYYWVPGAWVEPPEVGLLWTPPYWGFAGGAYGFHAGYWGRTVGFYGGIDYGFGYGGFGFGGGYWSGGRFAYNRAVTNVNVNFVHNTYVDNVAVGGTYGRVGYNGGTNGTRAYPSATELGAAQERHVDATFAQRQQFQASQRDRSQYPTFNGGRPATFANDRSGFGYANEVNARQGNQQSRISSGIRDGQITPGETRNLENRDDSIHGEVQAERYSNGGYLTGAEHRQIDERQNDVSRSIYNDRHNGNGDGAAAYRNGRTPYQEQHIAHQIYHDQRPRGPESKKP